MEKNDRRIIDFEEVKTILQQTAEELHLLCRDSPTKKLLGDVLIRRIEDGERMLRRRLTEPFHLVVTGDFKRGKSMLINALLGRETVPTAVTPETATINEISWGEEPSCEAVLENGRRIRLSPEDIRRDSIESLKKELPSPIRFVRLRENIPLLKDITLVDTPGTGELMQAFDSQVSAYLAGADAVIFVLSARSPLSLTEQAFLSSSVRPRSFSRILAVMNQCDCLDAEEDILRVRRLVQERLCEILPDTQVFAVSALDELCRKTGAQRPAPELERFLETQFLAFEDALQNDILLQREVIQSERCIAAAKAVLLDLENQLRLLRQSIKAGTEELEQRESELTGENSRLLDDMEAQKQALARSVDSMYLTADQWLLDFLARLKAEIQAIRSTAGISDLERHFQFYMIDMVRQAVHSCLQVHQMQVSDQIQSSLKLLGRRLALDAASETAVGVEAALPDTLWTGSDTVMFFAGDFLGLNEALGLFYVIGQAIAGFMRQKSMKEKQKDFLGPFLSGYDSFTLEVSESLKRAYEKLKLAAVNKLEELFRSRMESSLDSIRQARDILKSEGLRRGDALASLEDLEKEILKLQSELEQAFD